MIEVNCVYKHGRYERNWLQYLQKMFHVKVIAMQDGWIDGQTDNEWPTGQPDKQDIQMDQRITLKHKLNKLFHFNPFSTTSCHLTLLDTMPIEMMIRNHAHAC